MFQSKVGSSGGGDDSGSGSWKELRTSRNPGAEEQTTVSRKRKAESSGAATAAAANNGGNNVPEELLSRRFLNRRRLQVLVEAGPDMLAFETQACVELLEEQNIRIPSWICFSSVDGENAPSEMSPFRAQPSEVSESSEKSPKMEALGVGVRGFGNPLLEEMNQQSPLVFPDPWSLIMAICTVGGVIIFSVG
ncbi:homocysteine S-methyltransferase [Sarracenia purpurea var. burkii]